MWLRLSILVQTISLVTPAAAQTDHPFPDSAAMWVQYWEMMVTPPPLPQFEWQGTSNICFNGMDTVIDGTAFTCVDQCDMGYMGALREDSGKVYFLPADSLQEYTLYDFTLLEGDTVFDVFVDNGFAYDGWTSWPELFDYYVTQVDTITGRKVINLSVLNDFGPGQVWIEGLGSPFGLFARGDPINVSGTWAGIYCMSHVDTTWFFNAGWFEGYPGTCAPQYVGLREQVDPTTHMSPNPTSGRATLGPGILPHTTVVVSDCVGRAVEALVQPASGIVQIDLSHEPDGLYCVTLISDRGRSTHRIVKYHGHE